MPQTIPIASLGPTSINSDTIIQGIVTLVWPYSQATRTFALLLGADDFRTRSQQGQIRVQFSGPAARVVAESRIGVTDRLRLSLKGARWVEDSEVSTPGKSVHGELVFRNRLHLEILNDGHEERQIDVDQTEEEVVSIVPATPSRQVLQLLLGPEAIEERRHSTHSTPVLRETPRSILASDDVFLDEELDNEGARKRTRVSFGKIKDWRVSQRSPTPDAASEPQRKEAVVADEITVSSRVPAVDAATTLAEGRGKITMGPPALPKLQLPPTQNTDTAFSRDPSVMTPLTPTLRPVSGLVLPLPSPFPDEAMQSHFPDVDPSLGVHRSISAAGRSTEVPAPSVATFDEMAAATATTDTYMPSDQDTPPTAATTSLSSLSDKPGPDEVSQPAFNSLSVNKTLEESVMTRLFGTPSDQTHVKENVRPDPNRKGRLSDFDIAAMSTTDVALEETSLQKQQESAMDIREVPVASMEFQHVTMQRREHRYERMIANENTRTTTTDDALPGMDGIHDKRTSAIPPAMLQWATPRSSFGNVEPTIYSTTTEAKRQERKSGQSAIQEPAGVIQNNDSKLLMENTKSAEPRSAFQAETLSNGMKVTIHPEIKGLQTKHAYFIRLCALDRYLNITNREEGRVDIIAAISKSSKIPVKLEKGPRDYFTTLHVRDETREDDVQVELYRPYRSSLPKAQVGDVILLRAFNVQSHDHKTFLKSTNESAWCVWRFTRNSTTKNGRVEEDMRGPPIEYGSEERLEAQRLGHWFTAASQASS